ncbi:hypothetical protein BDV06DRAFT_155856 [Aspergillus oleicola]
MSLMAHSWAGASKSPMRPRIARPRYRLGATVSLTVFLAVLAAISPADATNISPLEKGHGQLNAKDVAPAEFPYLNSFNGLLINDEGEESSGPRGLDLVSRATTTLRNNHYEEDEISMGASSRTWSFTPNTTSSDSTNSTSKRDTTTVYLSLTICSGPIINETASNTASGLPQLSIYVSTSDQEPGPGKDGSEVHHSSEGHMSTDVTTDSDVYLTVVAPEGGEFTGSYSYQLAASTDGYFHNVNDHDYFLTVAGTGSETALLTTVNPADEDLTETQQKQWKSNTAVYGIFVNNANNTAVSGLSRSYCALENHSQAGKGVNVQTSMAKRQHLDNKLQEQFYITGLNRSSDYTAILGLANATNDRNGHVGGGGRVWRPKDFLTKSDGNCDVIYDLDFCSEVAYSVPSHPSLNMTTLRNKYDLYATDLYQNFNFSLQQVQCNTSNETIFSMATTCENCADAYKSWLCNVTIPRCEDYSSTSNITQQIIRNAGQAFPNGTEISNSTLRNSLIHGKPRNSGLIDKEINPGPYKEELPNVSVCHELVQKCPMSLGFKCPTGKYLPYSYAVNAASSLGPFLGSVSGVAVAVLGVLWVF